MPFTAQQFLDVFRAYNEAVWPLQFVFYALAVAAIALSLRNTMTTTNRVVGAILTFLWLWMGVVYQLIFFRTINPLASAFGVLFILQAALFGWFGIATTRLSFRPQRDWAGVVGWVLIAYALVGYPLIGYALGQHYPAMPTFGLSCPTTIFTIGLLLWAARPIPKALLIIPILWSMLGLSAATTLGIREDLGLIVAGAFAVALLFQPATTSRKKAAVRSQFALHKT